MTIYPKCRLNVDLSLCVWAKWLFVLKYVASMSIYCYKCVAIGYLSLMSPYCRFIVIRVCKMALCTNMCRQNVD